MISGLLKSFGLSAGAMLVSLGLAVAGPAKSPVDAELLAKAKTASSVRVIISLKAPAALDLRSGKLSDDRRSQIVAREEDQFLARLGTTKSAEKTRQTRKMAFVPMLAMNVTPAELGKLARDPAVASVVEDRLAKPDLAATVPLIGMPPLFTLGKTGSNAIVAVIDTGVDTGHSFIAGTGRIADEACFSSIVTGQSVSVCPNGQKSQLGVGAGVYCKYLDDGCYHGTHVAGIAMGNAPVAMTGLPSSGVAKGASVFPIQVFSYFPAAPAGSRIMSWTSDQIFGLERVYARRNDFGAKKIRTINMSLGGGSFTGACDTQPQAPIIKLLKSAGIVTVIAAGNAGQTNAMSAPGCISDAVSVAASDKTDKSAYFTNISATTTVFAPGVSIVSAYPQLNRYASMSGTSMAAPHVAGALAVLMDAFPTKTSQEIIDALKATGKPVASVLYTKPRIQVDKAYGLLNADLSVNLTPIQITRSISATTGPTSSFTLLVGSTTKDFPLNWSLTGLPATIKASAVSGNTGTAGQLVTFTVAGATNLPSVALSTLVFSEVGTTGPTRSVPVTVKTVTTPIVLSSVLPITIARVGTKPPVVTSFKLTVSPKDPALVAGWTLTGVPTWLSASITSGYTSGVRDVTFTVKAPAVQTADLTASLVFRNMNDAGNVITIPVTLKYTKVKQELAAR